MPRWRIGLALLAVFGYAALSQWMMVRHATDVWAVVALLGPLLAAGLGLAARYLKWPALLLVGVAGIGGLWLATRGAAADVNRLYLLQHVGFNLFFLGVFAASLRPGRLSLIGEFAKRVHPLTPAMISYTRHVTQSWVAYFFCIAALSLWAYFNCAFETWALIANLVSPVCVVALVVGEFLLRYRLHPEFERSTLADALRSMLGTKAAGS